MSELTTVSDQPRSDVLARPLLATLNLDWEKAIYLIFMIIAIVSRFYGLGDRVMSHDESLHTQFSYQFYRGDGYQHTPLMHGPSLFHLTAISYWLFGPSDLSARIPVAIVGVLLVLLPYFMRSWIGKVGALFASFILLISPYITYYSRYIRHDIYIITWALIVFIAIWHYLHEPKEKYLWWFTVGIALMFTTMETAFIYVAIFGSFLMIRIAPQLLLSAWFRKVLPALRVPILLLLLAVLLLGGGFIGQRLSAEESVPAATGDATQGFAADPTQDTAVTPQPQATGPETLFRWLQIAGVGLLSLGLFLATREMRPYINNYPEFDLIILFTTLIMPMASPFLTVIAGWNPRDYSYNTCLLDGQESMTSWQLLIARLGNSVCVSSFLSSGLLRTSFFLMLTLVVAILVGLWWDRRRWVISAAIFYSIFTVLFTSVFSNPGGWTSGMVGSLGYWLEQQGVQRGDQPDFFYFFVLPFYEFLPLIFSLAAIRLWLQQHRINKVVGYWLGLVLAAPLAYSFSNWLFNRLAPQPEGTRTTFPGLVVAFLILAIGILYWAFVRRNQLLNEYEVGRTFKGLVRADALCELVPFLTWWVGLSWVAYSLAGEKMPWLSSHFVLPMALLTGWYFAAKVRNIPSQWLFERRAWLLLGLSLILIITAFLALGPLLLGKVQLGNQQVANLNNIGRFLGGLVAAGIVFYLWRQIYQEISGPVRRAILVLSVFALLSLLTIRFTYMASFPNADLSTEYMVYAHGAPATKSVVMEQVEELSMRLYGDKSIKVAYDNDVSWPFTWYLRDYPNRVYFAENPSNTLNDSPVILVGSLNWGKTEPFLGNNYEQRTYTFLWWPMQEYRKISWDAILGNPDSGEMRGLGNPAVRQALWNIFFYRDYTKYGEVFGGTYRLGEWPLRHDLRLYIRKDVLAELWDYGIGAVNAEGLEDPYAENEFQLSPILALNESGAAGAGEGQLFSPRNVAVGPDGRIYVADSGNSRIQVFDQDGQFLDAWGGSGVEPGRFNEPWSVAVDENYVYVADTWNYRIQKFSHDGELAGVFGQNGSPIDESDTALGLFYGPRSIALLDDDRLLVTDTGNHRLQLLDREGNFISQVGNGGKPGNLPGQFNEPVGLAVAPDGSVYLADTWNGRIQQLTANLSSLGEWRVNAWSSQSINNKPYVAVDSAGRVYVTDPEGYRVLIFSPNGDYLGRFGQYGPDANSFGLPNGIAIDAQDNVYVADATNNRILKFPPVFGPSEAEPVGDDAEGG